MSCDLEKTVTEIKRGSTFEQVITCLDESDIAVNLSGWGVSSDLKESPGASGLLSFAIDSGSFASGIVGISATPAETLVLPADYSLQYDIKFLEPSGAVYYTETMYLKTSRHITD
jgi:hypothetical protein